MANNGNGNKKRNGNGNGKKAKARITNPLAIGRSTLPITTVSTNQRPKQQSMTTLSGSDFYTTITTNPTAAGSRILATIPVSPSAYPGTRLSALSNLWERYRFNTFTIRYIPAVPSTLACQYIVYIDTDPLDDPTQITDENALLRQATAQARSQQFHFSTPKNISLSLRKDDQMYYTGADKQNVRFSTQAIAYVLQVTDLIDFNGSLVEAPVITGSIYFDWSVCFSVPQINPSAISLGGQLGNTEPPLGRLVDINSLSVGENVLEGFQPYTTYLVYPQIITYSPGPANAAEVEIRSTIASSSSLTPGSALLGGSTVSGWNAAGSAVARTNVFGQLLLFTAMNSGVITSFPEEAKVSIIPVNH